MLCRQHCCNQYCDPVNVILSITKFTVPNISFFHCINIYFQRVRICLCSDGPFSQTFPDPLSVPFFVDGPLFLYSVGPKRSGIPDLVRRIRTKVPKMVRNWALGPDLFQGCHYSSPGPVVRKAKFCFGPSVYIRSQRQSFGDFAFYLKLWNGMDWCACGKLTWTQFAKFELQRLKFNTQRHCW